ncbi:MAG: hypothetical protein WEB04_09005 [Dehalococcoidia bacterium]
MRIQDFLHAVYDALGARLPKPLRDHQWRVRWSLLQVYFETASVHYEVWVQKQKRRIEIGLHFEGERDENYRWAEALAPHALEIQAQLGPSVELEEWTQVWTRLHETVEFEGKLTPELAAEIAERLARFIEVLEPIREQERSAAVLRATAS